MRYFVPALRLGVMLPAQAGPEEKLGGLPWGLPAARWPSCRGCGRPQTLLAQLAHHPERLDLGAPGRWLFVFQCEHDPGRCATWEGRSGANAAIIVDRLEGGPVPAPAGTRVAPEARVAGWTARDDGVGAAKFAAFFRDADYLELPDAVLDRVYEGTKLGGAPLWIQSADEAPKAPWRFAVQLDSLHRFEGRPPAADDAGCPVVFADRDEEPRERKPGAPEFIDVGERGWSVEAADFGESGLGYVFVRTDLPAPEALFFWQCA